MAVVIKSTITASVVATVTNNSGSDIALPYQATLSRKMALNIQHAG